MTLSQKALELIREHPEGLDDDEITEILGIKQRQQVYQVCARLAAAGQILRKSIEKPEKRKKIHNFPASPGSASTPPSTALEQVQRPWQKRLQALVAATGKTEDELLDRALQSLALEVLKGQQDS